MKTLLFLIKKIYKGSVTRKERIENFVLLLAAFLLFIVSTIFW